MLPSVHRCVLLWKALLRMFSPRMSASVSFVPSLRDAGL